MYPNELWIVTQSLKTTDIFRKGLCSPCLFVCFGCPEQHLSPGQKGAKYLPAKWLRERLLFGKPQSSMCWCSCGVLCLSVFIRNVTFNIRYNAVLYLCLKWSFQHWKRRLLKKKSNKTIDVLFFFYKHRMMRLCSYSHLSPGSCFLIHPFPRRPQGSFSRHMASIYEGNKT